MLATTVDNPTLNIQAQFKAKKPVSIATVYATPQGDTLVTLTMTKKPLDQMHKARIVIKLTQEADSYEDTDVQNIIHVFGEYGNLDAAAGFVTFNNSEAPSTTDKAQISRKMLCDTNMLNTVLIAQGAPIN